MQHYSVDKKSLNDKKDTVSEHIEIDAGKMNMKSIEGLDVYKVLGFTAFYLFAVYVTFFIEHFPDSNKSEL
jgi:hypothetical protein